MSIDDSTSHCCATSLSSCCRWCDFNRIVINPHAPSSLLSKEAVELFVIWRVVVFQDHGNVMQDDSSNDDRQNVFYLQSHPILQRRKTSLQHSIRSLYAVSGCSLRLVVCVFRITDRI